MRFKSPISLRVGGRSELDRKFARCIESLPEDTILSEDIKRRYVMSFELGEEKSELDKLKRKVEQQEAKLRELDRKIRSGVMIEKLDEEENSQDPEVDEEKMRRVQKLADGMTDW